MVYGMYRFFPPLESLSEPTQFGFIIFKVVHSNYRRGIFLIAIMTQK